MCMEVSILKERKCFLPPHLPPLNFDKDFLYYTSKDNVPEAWN